tara:strand:- start:5966 stop:6334 length:369 start_codon:yes stop_codon:yes gene_type:complete
MSWENILKINRPTIKNHCELIAARDLSSVVEETLEMIEIYQPETVADFRSVLIDFSELLSGSSNNRLDAAPFGERNISEAFQFIRSILEDLNEMGTTSPPFITEMLNKVLRIENEYEACKRT